MQIDWFTFAAQIINFLILLWLLKHFLFDRILKVMDQRKEKIESELQEAESDKKEAQKQLDEYRRKQEDLEREKQDILNSAREEAKAQKQELIEKARGQVDKMLEDWKQTVRQEQQSFFREFQRHTGEQIVAVTGNILKELADEKLEKKAVGVFIRRLDDMSDQTRDEFKKSLNKSGNKLTIAATFQVSDQDKKKLESKIQDKLGDVKVIYQTEEELILGLEMKADGRKVSWSVRGFLHSLEDDFNRLLEEKSQETEEELQESKSGNEDES